VIDMTKKLLKNIEFEKAVELPLWLSISGAGCQPTLAQNKQ
jgi:hypothetical protein